MCNYGCKNKSQKKSVWCLYSTNEKILFQEQYLPSYSIAGLIIHLVYKLVFSSIATVQLWLHNNKIREKPCPVSLFLFLQEKILT